MTVQTIPFISMWNCLQQFRLEALADDSSRPRHVIRWWVIIGYGCSLITTANCKHFPQHSTWQALRVWGRRLLRSHFNDIRKLIVPCTQQTWRQEFLGWQSSTVEWPSTRASAAGTSFWQLKRLVTLSSYRRYTNDCIYLSIYCSTQRVGHTSSSKLTLTRIWRRQLKSASEVSSDSYFVF